MRFRRLSITTELPSFEILFMITSLRHVPCFGFAQYLVEVALYLSEMVLIDQYCAESNILARMNPCRLQLVPRRNGLLRQKAAALYGGMYSVYLRLLCWSKI